MHAELPITSTTVVADEESRRAKTVIRVPWAFWLRQTLHFLSATAVALLSYLTVSHFILQSVQVVGVSMEPTLHNSERYLLNRWIYHFREPRVGEIVVIKDPVDKGYSVKRIVASQGTLVVSAGRVQCNGKPLAEPYLAPGTLTYPDGKRSAQQLTCGKGQFIVLGDNRLNSADSRIYGPVPRANILGLLVQ